MEQVRRLFPLILVGVTVLVYSSSFQGAFLFDDFGIVVNSPHVRHIGGFSPSARVFPDISFQLNFAASKLKVADYHLVNLFIHCAAGLFLFGLVRRTLALPRSAAAFAANADLLAFFVAAIWMCHPLQTQSVTYISQRYESMMGMFFLGAVYFFCRSLGQDRRRLWLLLCVVSSILAMGSKEVAVVLPLVIVFYDYFTSGQSLSEMLKARRKVHLCIFLTWGVQAIFLMSSQAALVNVGGSAADQLSYAPLPYLLAQAEVIARYLRLALWPAGLCFDYGWGVDFPLRDILLPLLLVGGLAVLTCVAVFRRWPSGFFGLWFFAVLAPTSSILPLPDVIFEHRMYLPLAAVVAFLVLAAYRLLNREHVPAFVNRLAACLALACIVACGVATYQRNKVYHSEFAMWSDVVAKCPENLRAQNDLAVVLIERGELDAALARLDVVLSSIPKRTVGEIESLKKATSASALRTSTYEYHYFRAQANMGTLYHFEQRDLAEAVYHYLSALRVVPSHPEVRAKLRMALRAKGINNADLDAEIDRLIRRETGGGT